MRLSVNKNSPFYDEAKINAHPLVFVDGVPVKGCFEASEEEGWADTWKTDDRGKIQLNEAKDAPVRQRLHGRVEIRVPS